MRDEAVFDGFLHQVRRKKALREDEVVKVLLVEAGTQGSFGFFAEGDEFGVAVEVAVGLTG
jgi:hypothetical protein